jgi:hypothetical protein
MKADLTRDTFRPEKRYSRVVFQQGRVQLDAELNEQFQIDTSQNTIARNDIIGACGSPQDHPGFEIGVTPDGSDLTISPGRIYVDGILCELDAGAIKITGSGASTLSLERVLPDDDDRELAAGEWVELSASGVSPVTVKLTSIDVAARSVEFASGSPSQSVLDALAAAGDGTLKRVVTYLTQPFFPGDPPDEIGLSQGNYLAALGVSEWLRIPLDDPEIQEMAVGVETAVRMQTIWQLKLFPLSPSVTSCSAVPDWSSLLSLSTGTLSARAQPQTTSTTPCTIPPGAGYQRLENHFYRFEVQDPGPVGKATIKHSRENGSVVAAWISNPATNQVELSDVGRDDALGFVPGSLVELTSDSDELAGVPGSIFTVIAVNGNILTISGNAPPVPDGKRHPKARRWEGLQTLEASWLSIEDGIEIYPAEGYYNTGDHWHGPARFKNGDIGWKRDSADTPQSEPRVSPIHHYCKLAVLQLGDAWEVLETCRPTFPPLTGLNGKPATQPAIHVTAVRVGIKERPLANDSPVQPFELAQGIDIHCDGALEPGTLKSKPTCLITLHLPYPFLKQELVQWALQEPFGTVPITLDSDVEAAGPVIHWKPSAAAHSVLMSDHIKALKQATRVSLTLRGDFVYGPGPEQVYVDGEVFGALTAGGVLDAKLPKSGDGQPGGDLEMWFWLK